MVGKDRVHEHILAIMSNAIEFDEKHCNIEGGLKLNIRNVLWSDETLKVPEPE